MIEEARDWLAEQWVSAEPYVDGAVYLARMWADAPVLVQGATVLLAARLFGLGLGDGFRAGRGALRGLWWGTGLLTSALALPRVAWEAVDDRVSARRRRSASRVEDRRRAE